MNHPHDKLFKETFSNKKVAMDFLRHFLPHKILALIDIPTITLQKESFIQKELKEFYSDLLYRVSFDGCEGYIYFLFEHKSYQDPEVVFQLLQYMLLLWKRELVQKENVYLPVVLPIVLYTGKQQWGNIRTIIDWLGGDRIDFSLRPFIPHYEFLVYNISSEAKEHVINSHILRSYIQLNKLLHLEDMERIYLMISELERLSEMKYFETLILYLFHVSESFSVNQLKEHLTMKGRQKLMTVAKKLRQEGIEIGKMEGKLEEKRTIALRLLELKMAEQEIMQVTGLTEKEIIALKEEL